MTEPKVVVLDGYGINCPRETKHAFEKAGLPKDNVERVHINDLISGEKRLKDYRIMVFPGGFSLGDDTGAGNALANKIRNNMWEEVYGFIGDERNLVIGICNGFQVMANLGIVPALEGEYGMAEAALSFNNTARFKNRWVDLKAEGSSPWLAGIEKLAMPVRHGEGRFYARPDVLESIEEGGHVALRYDNGEICDFLGCEADPNGSLNGIAGITDATGRVLGMMPHPEAAIKISHDPRYTAIKDRCRRDGTALPAEGTGLRLIRNGVEYCRKC